MRFEVLLEDWALSPIRKWLETFRTSMLLVDKWAYLSQVAHFCISQNSQFSKAAGDFFPPTTYIGLHITMKSWQQRGSFQLDIFVFCDQWVRCFQQWCLQCGRQQRTMTRAYIADSTASLTSTFFKVSLIWNWYVCLISYGFLEEYYNTLHGQHNFIFQKDRHILVIF